MHGLQSVQYILLSRRDYSPDKPTNIGVTYEVKKPEYK